MAVNEDILIKIDLFNHPKFQELKRARGGVCLRLFQLGAVARFKPDGILTGWTVRTIARQARDSEAESLAGALADSARILMVRFIRATTGRSSALGGRVKDQELGK